MYFKKGKKKHFLNVLNMQHIIFVSKIKKKKMWGFVIHQLLISLLPSLMSPMSGLCPTTASFEFQIEIFEQDS